MTKHDILLIGNDPDLLKTIGWVLDYKGFAVKVTFSPEAALEALVRKTMTWLLPNSPRLIGRAWKS